MDYTNLVFWKHGMLIKPHHLQYSDFRSNQHSWNLVRANSVYPWGIVKIEINEEMLNSGVISVIDFEAIFQDGTYVRLNSNAEVKIGKYTPSSVSRDEGLLVYIGLAEFNQELSDINSGVDNSSISRNNNIQRFIQNNEPQKINNAYEADTEAEITLLRYQLDIFTDQNLDLASDHLIFPICNIKQDINNDTMVIDKSYSPPILRIQSSPLIYNIMTGIYHNIKNAISQLDSYKIDTVKDKTDDGENIVYSSTLRYYLALLVLSKYMAHFKTMLDAENIHPFYAFDAIMQLLGEISFFSIENSILMIDDNESELALKYDHLDSGKAFITVNKMVKTILDTISVSEEMNVITDRTEDNYFTADIPESFFKINTQFFIVIILPEDQEHLVDDFKEFAVVASLSKINELITRALPGIELLSFKDKPNGLPIRKNAYYFKVIDTSDFWESVISTRKIAIFWNNASLEARIDLSVVNS